MTSLKSPYIQGIKEPTLEMTLSDGTEFRVSDLDDAAALLKSRCQSVPLPIRDEVRDSLVEYILGAAKTSLHAAQHDILTGLYNQGYFKSRLEDEILRCDRYNDTFSVVMIDLDDFKPLNDNLGHIEGDKSLRDVADILRKETRSSDIAARYGGDEFSILLPKTSPRNAIIMCQKVLKSIDEIVFATSRGRELHLGASFGITEYQKGTVSDEMIRRADNALYASKNDGKNRITVCSNTGRQEVGAYGMYRVAQVETQ